MGILSYFRYFYFSSSAIRFCFSGAANLAITPEYNGVIFLMSVSFYLSSSISSLVGPFFHPSCRVSRLRFCSPRTVVIFVRRGPPSSVCGFCASFVGNFWNEKRKERASERPCGRTGEPVGRGDGRPNDRAGGETKRRKARLTPSNTSISVYRQPNISRITLRSRHRPLVLKSRSAVR